MKKFACGLICLLLTFALTSCDLEAFDDIMNGVIADEVIDLGGSIQQSDAELDGDDTTDNGIGEEKPNTDENKKPNTNGDNDEDENKNDKPEPKPEEPKPEGDYSEILESVNNGVLKDSVCDSMKLPENMQLLQSDEATDDNKSVEIWATAVLYYLDGNVVNWVSEGDLLYVITSGNNRLVMIDTATMVPVYNTSLAAVPAELNIIGDEVYISLPDLCKIEIFSKADGTKKSSLSFEHEVSSFCLDGDTIYYTEHDQHCEVFKKNLVTGNTERIGSTFYFPKILLNKEDNILYIGESRSTGSAIYYYDPDTLERKSKFEKDNYGITNHTREIFHVGDMIFWGNYCLSDTNAAELLARYGTATYGSVNFASEEIVSTYEGLFLTDTYECIVDYDDVQTEFQYVLVTESENIFFRTRSFDKNIIVGVNFSIQ
ncbi:MAG: hypothetical protein J6M03_03050 [Clostridia bacterium]|nr:hypothetical protein [Clostridia bacterium]